MLNTEVTISSFSGPYTFLSNFAPVDIEYEGIIYSSVEHAFQAAKTLSIEKRLEIAATVRPGYAKRLGRHLRLRSDWEEIKVPTMADLVLQKFENEAVYAWALLDTSDKELIEGNSWHDNFWGICFCNRCPHQGGNHLGEILTTVREGLSEER